MPTTQTTDKPVFGPWVRGYVNAVEAHRIPLDGLAEALDCNIDRDGRVSSRRKWDVLDDTASYSDLYEHGGITYGVRGGQVGIVGASSFTAIRAVSGSVAWTSLNGEAIFADSAGVYTTAGGKLSRRDTYVEAGLDEESKFAFVDMPGGKALAYWQGRLLVLRGKSLLWSEAMDYGTHSRTRGYIRFSQNPIWMAPLQAGVYVGLENEVVFLRGSDPEQFVLQRVGGVSCPGAAAVMNTRHVTPQISGGAGEVAIWFTDVGFAIGRQDGSVLYPQAENIKGLPILSRTLVVQDDRVYVFTTEE